MTHRWIKLAILNLALMASSLNAWDLNESFGITESYIESYLAYREDSFKWKTHSKCSRPLVVQELCFDDVKMIEKGIRTEVSFCHWALKGDGKLAMAYNRAHDWAYDLSIGLGYHFDLCNNSIRLTPYIGYAADKQHFHSGCNNRYLSDKSRSYPITLARFDSKYSALWRSGWIGFDFDYAINECWKAYSDFAYHFVSLKGDGRTQFGDRCFNGFESRDDFRHKSNGWGFTWDAGINYAIDCNWLLDLGTQFEYRKVSHGHQRNDHEYKGWRASSRNQDNRNRSRIKRVEWRSVRLMAGLSYRF